MKLLRIAKALWVLIVFEREGLLPALEGAASVLDASHGKHGVQGWRTKGPEEHASKATGHLRKPGFDEETGMLHPFHAVNQCLITAQQRLEQMEELERGS